MLNELRIGFRRLNSIGLANLLIRVVPFLAAEQYVALKRSVYTFFAGFYCCKGDVTSLIERLHFQKQEYLFD